MLVAAREGSSDVCRGHSYFDSDTVVLFQVPLPNSVFVNTTESCEVERLVQSASCTCCDSVRSLVSLAYFSVGRALGP